MIWFYIVGVLVVLFGVVVLRGAPYVPSQKRYIVQALTELYPIGHDDVLVDIGSGDGVVLRQAAKKGAKAIGYEINPILVIISRFLSRHQRLVSVRLVDFWLTPLPDDTTVVYLFGVERDRDKTIRKLQNEANRLDHELNLICYGDMLGTETAVKAVGAYLLYTFTPLQVSRA